MFLICVLHDIGIAEMANGEQRFEQGAAGALAGEILRLRRPVPACETILASSGGD